MLKKLKKHTSFGQSIDFRLHLTSSYTFISLYALRYCHHNTQTTDQIGHNMKDFVIFYFTRNPLSHEHPAGFQFQLICLTIIITLSIVMTTHPINTPLENAPDPTAQLIPVCTNLDASIGRITWPSTSLTSVSSNSLPSTSLSLSNSTSLSLSTSTSFNYLRPATNFTTSGSFSASKGSQFFSDIKLRRLRGLRTIPKIQKSQESQKIQKIQKIQTLQANRRPSYHWVQHVPLIIPSGLPDSSEASKPIAFNPFEVQVTLAEICIAYFCFGFISILFGISE